MSLRQFHASAPWINDPHSAGKSSGSESGTGSYEVIGTSTHEIIAPSSTSGFELIRGKSLVTSVPAEKDMVGDARSSHTYSSAEPEEKPK